MCDIITEILKTVKLFHKCVMNTNFAANGVFPSKIHYFGVKLEP
jgi:hypothetical protein